MQGIVFARMKSSMRKMSMTLSAKTRSWTDRMARIGLSAKGIVYLILGALAFMAAFGINSQSGSKADQSGVFTLVKDWPGGVPMLLVLAAGLLCYSAWRFIQAFHQKKDGSSKKKWGKSLRYAISALVYLSLAYTAIQMALYNKQDGGNSKQDWARQVMEQPFGQWLLAIAALILAGVGFYQCWYGLSGKYKKHVEENAVNSEVTSGLLKSAAIGYVARGVVWLVIAWLLFRAAFHANAKEAGDTGEAFQFIHSGTWGTLLLAAIGIGLIAYGIFNFMRARFERFG